MGGRLSFFFAARADEDQHKHGHDVRRHDEDVLGGHRQVKGLAQVVVHDEQTTEDEGADDPPLPFLIEARVIERRRGGAVAKACPQLL